MLDLFNVNQTPEQRLESLRGEIKEYQKAHGIDSKKTKVKLFYGDMANFNDGILVITAAPKAKFFETPDDKFIISLLTSIELKKFFITYSCLVYGEGNTPKEIKEFGYYIKKLVDIINPKLIVCMGETSQFVFFKRKFMMGDFHGKQIGDYEGIPIMTTFPIYYYEEHSKFEDHSYKDQLKNKDWGAIKDKFKELK